MQWRGEIPWSTFGGAKSGAKLESKGDNLWSPPAFPSALCLWSLLPFENSLDPDRLDLWDPIASADSGAKGLLFFLAFRLSLFFSGIPLMSGRQQDVSKCSKCELGPRGWWRAFGSISNDDKKWWTWFGFQNEDTATYVRVRPAWNG